MPSWPLGHSCGIVSSKSVLPEIPTFLMGAEEAASPTGQFWSMFQKPLLQPGACFSSLSLIFHVPNSMHQIPLLLHILRVLLVSWQELCLVHGMLTTTLLGKYYYPLSITWGNRGMRRLTSLPKVLLRKWQSWVSNANNLRSSFSKGYTASSGCYFNWQDSVVPHQTWIIFLTWYYSTRD